jgi:hypothetical protein
VTRPRITLGKLVLTADDSQWLVVREKVRQTGKRKGERYDETVAYCTRLGDAVYRMGDQTLRESDATDVARLREELAEFQRKCAALLNPYQRVR